jgi:hypothetical protein
MMATFRAVGALITLIPLFKAATERSKFFAIATAWFGGTLSTAGAEKMLADTYFIWMVLTVAMME